MKNLLTILAVLFCSCIFSVSNISCIVRQPKIFDSTYTRTDSVRWKVHKDSAGVIDSVRYQKTYVTLSQSPGWLKIKKGTWYAIGLAVTALLFLIVKNNSQ